MTPKHSWTAAVASVLIHLLVLATGVSAVHGVTTTAAPRVARPLMFVAIVPAPDPARVTPIAPFRAPEPVHHVDATLPIETIPAPEPVVAPVPHPVAAPAPAEVRAPEPAHVEARAPEPAHAVEPPKPVQLAGFDAPAAHAVPIEIKRAAVGAFDTPPPSTRPQPGSDRPNVVADAGFGAAMATPSAPAIVRPTTDAGFGAARQEASAARAPATVKTTDFDATAPKPAATAAPSAVRIDDPLEILTKPTPAYTDEARKLKIEGDVVLDVEFTAAGEIHVLRVVRRLGHGLDEAATRAALGMRFKPALSHGKAVDVRTTVHIVFRLA
jgi:TonB family protein